MSNIIIRKAEKKEASRIAEFFMLAWPVEDILESNEISYEQLHNSMTDIAAMDDTVYSYENTYVAEVDADKPEAEALYHRLGFRYVGDKDFFGHRMRHMVRSIV